MTLDPGVDEALPLIVGGAAQLEDVTVQLEPHAAVSVTADPSSDSAHE